MLKVKDIIIGNEQPKICVSLTGKDSEALLEEARQAVQSPAQIIEWRYDFFSGTETPEDFTRLLLELRSILNNKVLLFTFRTASQGGSKEISLKAYGELNAQIAKTRLVDMIDIELEKAEFLGRQFIQELKKDHAVVLISSHHFDETPKTPTMIFEIGLMSQLGADIGKIVAMPHDLADVLRMMSLIEKARSFYQLPLSTIAMGELGKVTRISGHLTKSELTFAALNEAVAPGQLNINALSMIMNTLA